MTQNGSGGSAPALRADRLGRRYGQVWGCAIAHSSCRPARSPAW